MRFLFERIIFDLAALYDVGGLCLGMLWVPKAILRQMTERAQAEYIKPFQTQQGAVRILPVANDKLHGSEWRMHE